MSNSPSISSSQKRREENRRECQRGTNNSSNTILEKYNNELEKYYLYEELPLAIEYGMNTSQFWDEEEELLYIYQQAYYNKLHNKAFVEGLYINLSLQNNFANMFRKKGDKPLQYPKEPIFNPFKENISKEEQKEKSYVLSLDTSKNNNQLYNLKARLTERRKK